MNLITLVNPFIPIIGSERIAHDTAGGIQLHQPEEYLYDGDKNHATDIRIWLH